MNCCSNLPNELISLVLSAIAAYIGWNLMGWWRTLTKKRAKDVGGDAHSYTIPVPPAGTNDIDPNFPGWAVLRNAPYSTLHRPEYMANNPDYMEQMRKQWWNNQFERYYPSRTHDQDIPGEIKVVEGEVIRGEPLRIEHDT